MCEQLSERKERAREAKHEALNVFIVRSSCGLIEQSTAMKSITDVLRK
jgi:hypothetical protein